MQARRMAFLLAASALATACGLVAGLGGDYASSVDGSAADGASDATGVDRDGRTEAGPPPEDCLNGRDDDGDGLVDCADPDCAEYACIVAPPQAFVGLRTYPHALGDAGAPPCADAGEYFLGPQNESASCTPCSCFAADGGSCTAKVTCYTGSTCGSQTLASVLIGTSCTNVAGVTGGPNGCQATAYSAAGGACAPDGGALVAEDPWKGAVSVCASERLAGGGGCDAGEICVNKTGATSGPSSCLAPPLPTSTCPAPWSAETDFYPAGQVQDSRECVACACGAPTCSGGTLTIWGASGCSTGTAVSSAACLTNVGSIVQQTTWSGKLTGSSAGSCTPTGGSVRGTLQRGTPVKFCCIP